MFVCLFERNHIKLNNVDRALYSCILFCEGNNYTVHYRMINDRVKGANTFLKV